MEFNEKREIEIDMFSKWGDEKHNITVLRAELEKIFSDTSINSIVINGADSNDGKQHREIKIEVGNTEITMTKKYR